ncbi:MAG: FtsH protease activity modulator HflK [Gammaproteobacteria bacterium]
MGWNEPPGGNKGKDPWGNRGNGEGPPDLDEIVRKMQKGLGGLFGSKPGGMGRGNSSMFWVLILLIAAAVAASDMVYFIDTQERGVVLRFGAYSKTWQPGLNVRFPRPIENVMKVNVEQVRPLTHKAHMLTQDENIVNVEMAIQWKIKDPANYLFSVDDPQATLRQVTESAVREVIGKSKLDYVLTQGRSEIAQQQLEVIQQTLDDYKVGILISAVEMQPAKPPDQVKAAFDDAIKSREDEQRLVNEAQAYQNDIIPKARGAAARISEEANGYKARVIARAEGDASRFNQLLTEYERAPAVTRQRLYLDAMESVLSKTGKVLIDAKGNNSLIYLPIDRLIGNSNSGRSLSVPRSLNPGVSSPATQDIGRQQSSRSRRAR